MGPRPERILKRWREASTDGAELDRGITGVQEDGAAAVLAQRQDLVGVVGGQGVGVERVDEADHVGGGLAEEGGGDGGVEHRLGHRGPPALLPHEDGVGVAQAEAALVLGYEQAQHTHLGQGQPPP
jgi:hypothetical protein